jgi:hypothetical protein
MVESLVAPSNMVNGCGCGCVVAEEKIFWLGKIWSSFDFAIWPGQRGGVLIARPPGDQ